MISKRQEKFIEASQLLEEANISSFCDYLIELYADLTCNCFLNDQTKTTFKKQLELIEQLEPNTLDFEFNLVSGYIYLKNKREEQAYWYLTKAIELDNSIDLSYSLRAAIEPEINPEYEEDAMNAVLLNPSSRNYFVLANTYDYKNENNELEKQLICFGKAIQLRPDFACAYNNRAIKFKEFKDYNNAIEDYKKCIAIENTHWAYYDLWYCLDVEKRYIEALKYAKLGAVIHSKKIKYQFCLGVANDRMENYVIAINHYEKYLKNNPEDEVTKKKIQVSKIKLNNNYLANAQKRFHNEIFDQAVHLFEKYIEGGGRLSGEALDLYFLSLLKNNNKDFILGEGNSIFTRLDELKTSYKEKTEIDEGFSDEEENASKLIRYQSSYNIGFGKYEGESLAKAIEIDSYYIIWCIINLEHFSISKALFLDEKIKSDPDYLIALDHNLNKELIIKKWNPTGDNNYRKSEDDNYYNDRDTFDALTGGQFGDFGDFDGDFDDMMASIGRD
jgi:tetratricopeptide (TPR) repeat protein